MDLPEGFHQEVIEARENARKKVSTSLINSGGPNYETYALHELKNSALCFKPTYRFGLETIILFGIPLAFIGFIIYKYNRTNNFYFLIDGVFIYLMLGYFCLTLLASLFGNLKYFTFSKTVNKYFVGFPLFPLQLAYKKYDLDDIIAIQVLGEKLIDKESNAKRNSFELNLVLRDLERIHVIDHNNLQGILDDAEMLSKYLNIPLWHAKSSKESTSINFEN